MECDICFAQPIIVVIQVVAAFVQEDSLAGDIDGAIGVTFQDQEAGKVIHGFPAHGHGLYGHDPEGLVEGGFRFVITLLRHIDAGFVNEGQAAGVGGICVANAAVAIPECVGVFFIQEIGIADIGVGEGQPVENELIGDGVASAPVVKEGEGGEEFLHDLFFIVVIGDEVFAPERIAGGFIILAVDLVAAVDKQVDVADAGVDESAVVRIREVAAADIIDIAEVIIGVEDVGVGFAGNTFCDGLHKGGEGCFIVEAFAGVRLTGGSLQKGLEDYEE